MQNIQIVMGIYSTDILEFKVFFRLFHVKLWNNGKEEKGKMKQLR